LAAAAVDHIGRESLTLAADQRWAAATEVACAVRQLAATAGQFGPYAQVPALLRVQRLSDVVGQVQVLDAPSVQARAVLDSPVPDGQLDRSASAGDVAAHLVHAVNTAARDGECTVAASLTVAAAAESVAEQAAAVAAAFRGEASARPVWAQTAQTWRVLHAATRRFDDGSRYAAPTATAVTESALALHDAVTRLVAGPGNHPITDEVATQMRWAVNQLPALAGQVEQALTRAVTGGKLFAPARALPRSEDRAGDHIRNRAVMVRPPEIVSTRLLARSAGRVSAALAVELDRSAGVRGSQPQPNLIRALAADLPARALPARDEPARQLRPVAPEGRAR
jgi:hypothetical protein